MWSVCSDYLLGYSFVFLVQINVMSDIILSGCDSIRQLPNIWSDHQCNMLMLGISDMELMWTVQAIHTIFGCECRTVLLTCTNEEMTKSAPTVWQSLPPLVALDHTRLFLENIPPNHDVIQCECRTVSYEAMHLFIREQIVMASRILRFNIGLRFRQKFSYWSIGFIVLVVRRSASCCPG